MEKKFCDKCNLLIKSQEAKFCSHCGARVKENKNEFKRKRISKRKKLIFFSILLALIGIVFWNAPGYKSRRLGNRCNGKYNSVIEAARSNEERFLFENSRDVCYTNIARKYQNTQLCDWIKDEQMKNVCYAHVYYWNKSVEFCENDDQKNICLHVISIKNKDKSICSKIDNNSIRKLCEQKE
ncbi:MAG: hypothetical protein U0946_00490 [Patescibacteria group bacterium]|nr:hypothetical protein [Patescibacteria group bacterium]